MESDLTTERQILRHLVATMTYRAAKAIRNAPVGFGEFRAHESARTPVQILAHIGDLCDWGLSLAKGEEVWRDAIPQIWEDEISRFYASVEAFDDYAASSSPMMCPIERLIQGPVADAISHVGQIAMLRRFFGNPIWRENYFRAEIKSGQVGRDLPPPRREFD